MNDNMSYKKNLVLICQSAWWTQRYYHSLFLSGTAHPDKIGDNERHGENGNGYCCNYLSKRKLIRLMGSFQMLNCISKENLLYVKASNIFVGFEFRGNSSAAAYATVSYDGR